MNKIFKTEIAFVPILLYIVQQYIISGILFYFLILLSIVFSCFVNKGKLLVPDIIGFKSLITYQLLTIFIGLLSGYTIIHIVRDVYYTSIVILVLWLGYSYGLKNKEKKDVLSSMVLLAILLSGVNYFKLLINIRSLDFVIFRTTMSTNIYLISVGFIVCVACVFHENALPLKIRNSGLFFLGINTMFCMSRGILFSSLGSAITVLVIILFQKKDWKNIRRVFFSIIIGIIVFAIGAKTLPEDVLNEFNEKLSYGFDEISSDYDFDDMAEASNHWRGYEVSQAKKLMKEGNFFQKLFGYGAGKQIPVPYLEKLYKGKVAEGILTDTTPLLHNGYYTIWVKGGMVGLLIYILFFARNIFFFIKQESEFQIEKNYVVGLMVLIMIQMYVTRGLAEQFVNFWWCFLIGWLNSKDKQKQLLKDGFKNDK